MIRVLLTFVFTFFIINAIAENVKGVVVNKDNHPLPYSTVRIKNRRIGTLTDSVGQFNLKISEIRNNDTIIVSYIGYETKELHIAAIERVKDIRIELISAIDTLPDVTVYPKNKQKRKIKVAGKKHNRAILKTSLNGEMIGECFGYEFHAKKNKKQILNKVGFYYCNGDRQMTKMKFRINIYDMGRVKKSPSSEFVNVLTEPIYFEYALNGIKDGKFEYKLLNPIILPKDALVEIEFLEDLKDEIFWFKSNLIGKRSWTKSLIDGEWIQTPFATPFFIECIEVKDKTD